MSLDHVRYFTVWFIIVDQGKLNKTKFKIQSFLCEKIGSNGVLSRECSHTLCSNASVCANNSSTATCRRLQSAGSHQLSCCHVESRVESFPQS